MDEFIQLVETRKIIQRGTRGGATLLPRSFMENNNLYRGTKLNLSVSVDRRSLFIATQTTTVSFTRQPLEITKQYGLGLHVIRGKVDNSYPIITLPQMFLLPNELKPGDEVDIFSTPHVGCLVIRKRGEGE